MYTDLELRTKNLCLKLPEGDRFIFVVCPEGGDGVKELDNVLNDGGELSP